MSANNSVLRPLVALIGAAAVLTCGGGDGAGPGDSGPLTGSWSVSIPAATGGGVSCALPPVILDLEHGGGTLRGDFRATGAVNCLYQGAPFTGTLGNGKVVNGSVSGSAVAFDLSAEALHFGGTLTGDTAMSGGMSWQVTFVGTPVGQVTLGGNWSARRVAAGVPDSILVLPATVMLPQLDSVALTASVRDGFGAAIPGVQVAWQSEDTALATVTTSGLVRSKGPGGLVTIRATAGDAVGRRTVSIQQVAADLDLSPDSLTLHRGRVTTLQVTIRDRVGTPMAGTTTATSLNPGIFAVQSVAANGTVTLFAPGGLGATAIVAQSGSLRDTSIAEAYSVPATIDASPARPLLGPGDSLQLTVVVRDSTGDVVTPSVALVSLDPGLLQVAPSGYLTAGGGEGLARVEITAPPAKDTLKVLIRSPLPVRTVTTQNLGGEPYGLAYTNSGVVYVTEKLGGRVFRGAGPGYSFAPVLTPGGVVLSVAFSPSGDTAFVARNTANQVLIVDVTADTVVGTIAEPQIPTALAVSSDGTRLFVGNVAGVRIRSLPDLADLGLVSIPGLGASLLTAHPSQPLVYATIDRVYEIGGATGGVLRAFGEPATSYGGSAIAPDLSRIYVPTSRGVLIEYDLGTGQPVDSTSAPGFGISLSADGRDLLVASNGGVTIVDRQSLVVLAEYPLGAVYHVIMDPATGAILATDVSGKLHILQ